jgi:hypothetical protein
MSIFELQKERNKQLSQPKVKEPEPVKRNLEIKTLDVFMSTSKINRSYIKTKFYLIKYNYKLLFNNISFII